MVKIPKLLRRKNAFISKNIIFYKNGKYILNLMKGFLTSKIFNKNNNHQDLVVESWLSTPQKGCLFSSIALQPLSDFLRQIAYYRQSSYYCMLTLKSKLKKNIIVYLCCVNDIKSCNLIYCIHFSTKISNIYFYWVKFIILLWEKSFP